MGLWELAPPPAVSSSRESASNGRASHSAARFQAYQGSARSSTSRLVPAAATVLGLHAAVSRRLDSTKRKRVQRATESPTGKLPSQIAKFYDASTEIWLDIWGEHLHHGYYPEDFSGSLKEHQEAQVTMIEEVLKWADVPEPGTAGAPKSFLDVGCGVGGSSRHLQRKYGGTSEGITLSPEQVSFAQTWSERSSQAEVCKFQVANALSIPFPDNSFDLVWSLESGEHIPQKEQFMSEMHRVCKPGGRVILVTWVHRDLLASEQLKKRESRLLKTISWAYHLPDWCSIADYQHIAKERLGITNSKTADWTQYIMPFWGAVIRTALQPRGWRALYKGGWRTVRGALVMPLMRLGYTFGTIKFGLLTYTKQANEASSPSPPRAGPARPAFNAPSVAVSSSRSSLVRRMSTAGQLDTPLQPNDEATPSPGFLQAGPANFLRTVWDFSRPHTLIGSFISVVSVHAFAAVPIVLQYGAQAVLPTALASAVVALVPALLVNIYITGLNQVFDVEIDKVNKPYLPIPAGRLTVREAWGVCTACLGAAVCWSWMLLRTRSMALHLTLASSAVLGTMYSAPPIRLKRYPFFAAFCIVVVRGIIVNLGFYWFAMEAFARAGLVGAACDMRGGVSALFFAMFGLVIALMKDIPDVLGDRMEGIRSLSVRLGPRRVLKLATSVLRTLLLSSAGGFAYWSAKAVLLGKPMQAAFRVALALVACLSLNFLAGKRRRVDPDSPSTVYAFYMDVWRVFYISYLCLPFAT